MAERLYDAYHQEIELTDEQEACLKYSGDRTLMVKGYAGAGKSLVLMELARRLMDKYVNSKNKVAIVTFQNTLVSSTKELLQANDSDGDGIFVTTINSYVKEIYDYLVRTGVAPRKKYPFNNRAGETQRITFVKNAINEHQKKYGNHRFHKIEPAFWLEEFTWMKDMNVWMDDMDMYLTIPRKGRGGKVRMSAADRVTAYQLYTCYCDVLEKAGYGDWEDQTLFIIRNPNLIPDGMKYENILIDESQDLSMAQMIAIMMLYTKKMIVAMDMNQRIFGKQWTPKLLGIETTTKKLTKSMRTTKQIDALAESVRSKNDLILSEDDRSLRAIPTREGNLPELVHLEDAPAERKFVINRIKKYLEANDRITIGVIAARNKQIAVLSEWLSSENIEHEQISKDSTFHVAQPGVKLVSSFGAKGLEFDIVIIPMFAEGNFPYSYVPDDEEEFEQFMIKMRNIVYVSMTRARFQLLITFWGNKGSRFINDMDPSLYQMIGDRPIIRTPVYRPGTNSANNAPAAPLTPTATPVQMTLPGTPKEPEQMSFEIQSPYPSAQKDTTTASPRRSTTTVSRSTSSSDKPTQKTMSKTDSSELVTFLEEKGIELVDKRPKGGALWIVGDKSLDTIIQETNKKFGAMWIYKAEGGIVTKHRPGWYTKSAK